MMARKADCFNCMVFWPTVACRHPKRSQHKLTQAANSLLPGVSLVSRVVFRNGCLHCLDPGSCAPEVRIRRRPQRRPCSRVGRILWRPRRRASAEKMQRQGYASSMIPAEDGWYLIQMHPPFLDCTVVDILIAFKSSSHLKSLISAYSS